MPAVRFDLYIEQGTTWSQGYQVTVDGAPLPAGWTARSQVRARAGSTDTLFAFAPTIAGDVVTLSIDPATSSAWSWTSGVYDVEIVETATNRVLRIAQGTVSVSPEVTR